MKRVLIPLLLLFAAGGADAVAAGSSGGFGVFRPGQDIAFVAAGDGTAIDRFDYNLVRWTDRNADGDFADGVGTEALTVASSNNIADCAQAPPVAISCDIDGDMVFWIWNGTLAGGGLAGQLPGNYSLSLRLETSLGAVIAISAFAFRIQGESPVGIAPFDALFLAEFQATRALTNQSYGNASANLTVHNQTVHDHIDLHNTTQEHDFPAHGGGSGGVCDDACQANITEAVVANLTLTEGGDTFILGHTQDLVLNSEARLVLVLLATGFLVWLTTRRGNIWSFLAMLGAIGLFAFVLTHYADFTASPATNAMLLALPLLVFIIAPMRIMFGTGSESPGGMSEGLETEDY